MLRVGPFGDGFGADPDGLTLAKLEASPHGIDFGAMRPRLPDVLRTPSGKIELAPPEIVADVPRLEAELGAPAPTASMVLIGRRQLRSNNSWMHNLPALVKGKDRCTVQVHPGRRRAARPRRRRPRPGRLERRRARRPGRDHRRDHARRRLDPARLGPRRARRPDGRRRRARRRQLEPARPRRGRRARPATPSSTGSRSRSPPPTASRRARRGLGSRRAVAQLEFDEATAKQLEVVYGTRRHRAPPRALVREALAARPGRADPRRRLRPRLLRRRAARSRSAPRARWSASTRARRCWRSRRGAARAARTSSCTRPRRPRCRSMTPSFDAALSVQVLEYVDDIAAALGEIRRGADARAAGSCSGTSTGRRSRCGPPTTARMRRILAAWDEHLADPSLPRHADRGAARRGLRRIPASRAHSFATNELDRRHLRRLRRPLPRAVRRSTPSTAPRGRRPGLGRRAARARASAASSTSPSPSSASRRRGPRPSDGGRRRYPARWARSSQRRSTVICATGSPASRCFSPAAPRSTATATSTSPPKGPIGTLRVARRPQRSPTSTSSAPAPRRSPICARTDASWSCSAPSRGRRGSSASTAAARRPAQMTHASTPCSPSATSTSPRSISSKRAIIARRGDPDRRLMRLRRAADVLEGERDHAQSLGAQRLRVGGDDALVDYQRAKNMPPASMLPASTRTTAERADATFVPVGQARARTRAGSRPCRRRGRRPCAHACCRAS